MIGLGYFSCNVHLSPQKDLVTDNNICTFIKIYFKLFPPLKGIREVPDMLDSSVCGGHL